MNPQHGCTFSLNLSRNIRDGLVLHNEAIYIYIQIYNNVSTISKVAMLRTVINQQDLNISFIMALSIATLQTVETLLSLRFYKELRLQLQVPCIRY